MDEPEFPWSLEELERAKASAAIANSTGDTLEALRILLVPLIDMLIEAKAKKP